MAKTITEKFKQTEIGEIPADWDVKKFIDSIENSVEESKKSELKSSYKSKGKYPIVDQGKELIAGYTDEESKVYKKSIPLIIFGDHTRIFKYIDFPFVTGADGTKLLKANEELFENKFLYFALGRLNIPNRGYNRHFKILKEQFLPCPSKPEQEKIAYVLSKLQKAVENQEKIISDLKELKSATMAKLFREGTRGEPLKQTEIGEIPQSWDVSTLRTVCDKTTTINPTKNPDKIIEYVDVSSVSSEQCRIIDSTKYLGKDVPGRARKLVKHRDVIFATVRPTLRRIAVVPKELDGQVVSTAFCVIRAIESKACPEFLYYVVSSSDFIVRIGHLQRGANYPAVTDANVLSQMVALPEYKEQKEIANILDCISKKEEIARKKLNELNFLFSSTLNQLMTGKIRLNLEGVNI
ncbi:MAG: restriction endonuclease subunit S [Elusimicrobia bacterium]|nr:restriction endonuclease subunit S [Elusimicrobiota bacterium]